ncbi:MAG: hypothetical protein J5936_04415 [Acholeplasmatales bacterium]|nr:hypothetical protein [Acholeplasmatales bacterium]
MKMKKFLGLTAVAGAAVLTLSACGDDKPSGEPSGDNTPTQDPVDYQELAKDMTDEEVYNKYFGAYEDEMILANKATNDNDKYYHFAKAESVLYDQALILPVNTQGGRYSMSRIGIGSAPYALWGNDSNRLKNLAIATEFIKASDRADMKTKLMAQRNAAAPYSHYSDGSHKTSYNAATELTNKGYTLKRDYKAALTTFPKTYSISNTYRASDAEILWNFTDTLIQYDNAGNIVPALASSWTRSDDGKKYTFTIRSGAKWVDAAGQEHGEVTAQDFVYGIKRAAKSYTYYMLEKVKNFDTCYSSSNWDTLGVTAVNNNTLEIELSEACDYFLTYLTYNTFAPVQQAYCEQKGENFGKTFNDILYCGAFVCTGVSDKSSLTMARNEKYWDNANTTIDSVTYSYEDGSNETTMYNKLKNGTYDSLSLSEARITLAKNDNLFDTYAFITDTNATSYFGGFNLARASWENDYDASSASKQTDDEKLYAKCALRNTNFRRAILAGLNKEAYNAPVTGAAAALYSLRNTYVPYDYVTLTGESNGYASGTQYGAIVEKELKKGVFSYVTSLKDGVNAYYNAAKSKAFLDAAWSELQFDSDFVVKLDYPVDQTNVVSVQQAQILKENIETVSEGRIEITLVMHKDEDTYLYSNYYVDAAADMNYDFDISSGWGPDHGDPSTYLNSFLPAGDMVRLCGIEGHDSTK